MAEAHVKYGCTLKENADYLLPYETISKVITKEAKAKK
jgi:hypothetical protein